MKANLIHNMDKLLKVVGVSCASCQECCELLNPAYEDLRMLQKYLTLEQKYLYIDYMLRCLISYSCKDFSVNMSINE